MTADVVSVSGIERNGVDRIPDGERTATPWTFFVVFIGGSVGLGAITFGWVGATFGMGLWATVSAIAVGTLVGQVLLVPLILIGSRTATNNATSSGAAFGVRGRYVGSGIGLVTSLVSVALTVWTSGSAGVAVAGRLFGLPDGPVTQAVAYAVVAAISATVAIWGFRWLVRATAILFVFGGLAMLLMLVAFADRIAWDYAGTGEYPLGGFWPTWLSVATTVGVSGALVVCVILGDWTRYIRSDVHPPRRLALIGSAGVFIGFVVPAAVGAFVTTALTDPFTPFTVGIALESPGWYAVLLLPFAVLGGVGLVAQSLYSAGLDLDAIVVRLNRVQATAIIAVVGVVLVYLGLAAEVQASIGAALLVMAELSAPWAVIVGIDYLRARGHYDAEDLQVFNRGRTGGRYWFSGGWSWQATLSWAIGAVVGLLTIQTLLFSGPLSGIAAGVDISLVAAVVVAGALYAGLTAATRAPAGIR